MTISRCLVAPLALVLAAAGCGEGACVEPSPEGGAPRAAIIGGTPSRADPELARLSNGCSAELIAPDVVLSAAHCFEYRSADGQGALGSLTFDVESVTRCPPSVARFPVDRVHVFASTYAAIDCNRVQASTPWSPDVAVVHLAAPVPAEVAAPRALAAVAPVQGDAVTVVGYGCPANGAWDPVRTKRFKSFTFDPGAEDALCGGDSGGALLVGGRDGPIAGIVSQSPCPPPAWTMVFGDVVGLRAEILAELAAWGSLAQPR